MYRSVSAAVYCGLLCFGPTHGASLKIGQTPKSDIPNIAPKIVTPENYLQIWESSATLIGQLAIVTLFGAILGGKPLSGPYPIGINEISKFGSTT